MLPLRDFSTLVPLIATTLDAQQMVIDTTAGVHCVQAPLLRHTDRFQTAVKTAALYVY